jgi:hypothetical protein
MAENIVVKEALTEEMIRAGAELVRKLDQLHWPVMAAMWFYFPEVNQWRLLLGSPEVRTKGPKVAYTMLRSALSDMNISDDTLALTDIGVMEPESPLIQVLRGVIRTGPSVSGIRFTQNVIDGHFIDDAYIYRIDTSELEPRTQP